MRHDFADGKYTVINDNGRLTALRHGEPWGRDLVGDTLVYWMLCEVDDLRAQRDALLEALKLAKSIIGHPDDAHSQMIDAAIKAVEEGQ